MTDTTTGDLGELRVSFPSTSGFLRISRLNATAFASDQGFDVEELDDFRLAVDEVVTWLNKDCVDQGVVVLTMRTIDRGVVLVAERSLDDLPDRDMDDLQHAILGATVDSHEIVSSGGVRRVMLEKHRR